VIIGVCDVEVEGCVVFFFCDLSPCV
jgi:hypothetical protein